MTWWTRLIGKRPRLTAEQARRLAAWHALPAPNVKQDLAQSRVVVVDVETSGLNLARDRLIAIGAVAVQDGQVVLADSLEIVLQQARISDHGNILIHGIGGTAQAEGIPPAEALLAFLEYLGRSPLVAFHVTFDETMIRRALKSELGLDFKHPWVDLAYIAPALYPDLARQYRALDEWTGLFHIRNYARHNALADALSTAQLLLALRHDLARKAILSFKDMQELEKAQRWVNWNT